MWTPWIEERTLEKVLARNEAFWSGALEDSPLLWVTAPNARPGTPPPEPPTEEALWTDVDYATDAAEDRLARTHYAGDALPVYCPWLGPDQFAAWLGAEITLKPRESTSWIRPFVHDWAACPTLDIRADNPLWQTYLALVRQSVEQGRGKWVTGYPDLHTGIDALSAIRGPDRLAIDLVTDPEPVRQAMDRMTELFKYVVDTVSDLVLPSGQGTSNWTLGWSARRYLCIGQNDFTCMIGPDLFRTFCWRDTVETCRHADVSLYHLDGPGALRHLDTLLELDELNCIQWVQGAGAPLPSQWTGLLRRIQEAGKSVQVLYVGAHGSDGDLFHELDVLCEALDPLRLFFWAEVATADQADALVAHARRIAR